MTDTENFLRNACKNSFSILMMQIKQDLGKICKKSWVHTHGYPENISLQLDGGFNTKLFGKDLGVIAVLNYSNNKRRIETQQFLYNQRNES
jgi:hypothetical protein